MRKLLLLISFCAAANAQNFLPAAPSYRSLTRPSVAGKDLWRASIASLAVANALDVHSSWGKHELNSALAGSNGTFGTQGALIKLGFQGGLVGVEYLLTRHRPSAKLYRVLSFLNFGTSAAIGGVAAHNYSVPRVR